jgi:hypothetical protein
MPNDDTCPDYVPNYSFELGQQLNGAEVKKLFGHKYYNGTVEFLEDEYNTEYAFLITWTDGDQESMNYAEVISHLIQKG